MTARDIALLAITCAGLLILAGGLFGSRYMAVPAGALLIAIPLFLWNL